MPLPQHNVGPDGFTHGICGTNSEGVLDCSLNSMDEPLLRQGANGLPEQILTFLPVFSGVCPADPPGCGLAPFADSSVPGGANGASGADRHGGRSFGGLDMGNGHTGGYIRRTLFLGCML